MSEQQKTIDFYFDIASPYSYFAACRVEQLGEKIGRRVNWLPLLLGGVFKATGNKAPATVAAKARYLFVDLHRWAGALGIPFHFSSHFPPNTLTVQRVLCALDPGQVPPVAAVLFTAFWAEQRNIADDKTLIAVLDDAGFDGAALVAQSASDLVKQRLRHQTDRAIERGVFGVPTVFVDDEMFWGHDRFDLIERLYAV
ncbi:MAG: 2-hydroxychromene-2-carboxylate isomerase [Deltaproteobacteria bacterium]|nr:2-hydroxychromene-2-carboxylate isomerase [Deltaproteobacteria bacterium]